VTSRTGLFKFPEIRDREHRARLLKERLAGAGSLLIGDARECAVLRDMRWRRSHRLCRKVTEAISNEPLITVRREEVALIDRDPVTVIASGPLTSDALSQQIVRLSRFRTESSSGHCRRTSRLYFYDSISPIVEADSIDMSRGVSAARYDKDRRITSIAR